MMMGAKQTIAHEIIKMKSHTSEKSRLKLGETRETQFFSLDSKLLTSGRNLMEIQGNNR